MPPTSKTRHALSRDFSTGTFSCKCGETFGTTHSQDDFYDHVYEAGYIDGLVEMRRFLDREGIPNN